MTICQPCLEKSSKDSNSIYLLFARIKTVKIWYRWFQGRPLWWSTTSAHLDAVSQSLFQKNSSTFFFLGGRGEGRGGDTLANFCRIHIKSSSWWIYQKILSKKIKQTLLRGGGETRVAMELQKKPEWTITKFLL